jgi:dTMP kinase
VTFITFEGPEGAGKSTQIKALAAALREAGHEVTLTREPGGAEEAEALRELLLSPGRNWSPLAEALLMNAARDAHLRQTILPALGRGEVVLCDRFFDSTRAYQAVVGEEILEPLHRAVVSRMPELTMLLDLPAETGLARAKARGAADRFERKGLAYHEGVRQAFLAIADAEPERVVVVDAAQDIATVTKDIRKAVHLRLPALLGPGDGDAPSA